MEVVILLGGEGLRFKQNKVTTPKYFAKINNIPLVLHIINHYRKYHFQKFILCIRDDFKDMKLFEDIEDEHIKIVKTGNETTTAGRIKRVESLIQHNNFMVTYGDGICDIDISKLVDFHITHKRLGTLTAVKPYHQFGILKFEHNESNKVLTIDEKPRMEDWVNGGFFVFNKQVFEFIERDDKDSLEIGLLKKLAKINELSAYKHEGFWKNVDTYKDLKQLELMYENSPF